MALASTEPVIERTGRADILAGRAGRRDSFEAVGLLLGILGVLLLVAATIGGVPLG